MSLEGYRCKVCGNPELDKRFSSLKSPNRMVCDWTCASILNSKKIYLSAFIGVFGTLGAVVVYPWLLVLFLPYAIFGVYSTYLIITQRSQKQLDRLEFVGEEDEDSLNIYTR